MAFKILRKNKKETKMGIQFNFTEDMLRRIIGNNSQSDLWFAELFEVLPKYNIDTPQRIAGFLAQCAHESADFKRLEENLNYSESALNRVFKRYFGPGKENASEYARNPEKIANYVYMDKYRSRGGALGNVEDGDGWRFRGRGLKQLTGRSNYEAFAKTVDLTAEEASDYIDTKRGAVESACWFWDTANCNSYADRGDIVGLSKRINGGTIGLPDRKKRWKAALAILDSVATPTVNTSAPKSKPSAPKPKLKTWEPANITNLKTLRIRSEGDQVVRLQEQLGVNSDGIFGPGTQKALRDWQKANRLVADGIAGPKTLRKIYNI
jgi:putative chitinase